MTLLLSRPSRRWGLYQKKASPPIPAPRTLAPSADTSPVTTPVTPWDAPIRLHVWVWRPLGSDTQRLHLKRLPHPMSYAHVTMFLQPLSQRVFQAGCQHKPPARSVHNDSVIYFSSSFSYKSLVSCWPVGNTVAPYSLFLFALSCLPWLTTLSPFALNSAPGKGDVIIPLGQQPIYEFDVEDLSLTLNILYETELVPPWYLKAAVLICTSKNFVKNKSQCLGRSCICNHIKYLKFDLAWTPFWTRQYLFVQCLHSFYLQSPSSTEL